MKRAGLLALSLAFGAPMAPAQTADQTAPSACPTELGAVHLYGQWQLTLTPLAGGTPEEGTVSFERHPEYAETVRGRWQRMGETAVHLLSGDITDGELVLDESVDGTTISAVWVGAALACGQRFAGERRRGSGDGADAVPDTDRQRFVLRRSGGWR